MGNKYLLPAGIILFIATVVVYYLFAERGRDALVIPGLDVAMNSSAILEESIFQAIDFENPDYRSTGGNFKDLGGYTGRHVNEIDKKQEYSFGITGKWADIKNSYRIRQARFSFWCKSADSLKEVTVVFAVDSASGQSVIWQSNPLKTEPGKWDRFTQVFDIPLRCLNPDYHYKFYVWNKAGENFLLDDFSYSFYSLPGKGAGYSQKFSVRAGSLNFESGIDEPAMVTDQFHSGKASIRLSSADAFTPGITYKASEITTNQVGLITLGAWVFPEEEDLEAVLVATIKSPDGVEYFWEGRSTDKGKFPKAKWTKHRAQYKLPAGRIRPDDVLSGYVWNKGGTSILVDDLEVVFGEQQARDGGEPALDMSSAPIEGIPFGKNKPPFKTEYLVPEKKSVIASLVSVENLHIENRWTPGDCFSSGRFARGLSLDQVARIRDESVELYGYCQSAGSLKRFYSGRIPFAVDKAIAFDSDKDGTNELLGFDANGRACIIKFPGKLNVCGDNANLPSPYCEIFNLPVADSLALNRYIVIGANGEFKCDFPLLLFDKFSNKCFGLIPGPGWKEISFASQQKELQIIYVVPDGKNGIHCIFSDAGRRLVRSYTLAEDCSAFQLNLGRGEFPALTLLGESGEWSRTGPEHFLLLNRNHGLNLKSVRSTPGGVEIMSTLEFRETEENSNPRFYESQLLIPGTFFPGSNEQILAVMGQCEKWAPSESRCTEYDKNSSIVIFTLR